MKINKILLSCLSAAIMLTSCAFNGVSDLKLSSGNKLIDTKGYHSNKRRPLYNKKYINKAKQNIINSDIDDEEEDDASELINPQKKNLDMYKGMIRRKKSSRPQFANKKSPYMQVMMEEEDDDDDELDLPESRALFSRTKETKSKHDLESEISEIRDLLQKTKDEITKAKCPYNNNSENKKAGHKQASHTKVIKTFIEEEPSYDEDMSVIINDEINQVAKPYKSKTHSSSNKPKIKHLPPVKSGAMTSVVRD